MPLRRKAFCWAYRACGVPKGITGSRDGQPVWETNWREPPTAIGRGGGIVTRIPEIVSSLETPSGRGMVSSHLVPTGGFPYPYSPSFL